MKKTTSLEDKFLFRLIKVVYWVALLSGVGLVLLLSWSEKPYTYKENNSFITCSNGTKYSPHSAGIYSPGKTLSYADMQEAADFCGRMYEYKVFSKSANKVITVKREGLFLFDLDESKFPEAQKYTYSFVENEKTRGSWQTVILWGVGGTLGVYVVLNLIRETLVYIFFGRKFQWEWLKKIFGLFG